MSVDLRSKVVLLAVASVLIVTAFWLSNQGAGAGAPDLVRVATETLVSDMHPLDEVLIRHPREGRALSGFYRPPLAVAVDSFEIDSCEVTQGDYGRFLQWHQTRRPKNLPEGYVDDFWQPAGINTDSDWLSRTRDHKFLGRNEVPATGIRPAAARAYCRQLGGDLPTEFEWEVAAGGAEQRLYPWGDVAPATNRLFHDPILNVARECGVDEALRTPDGIADLGNGVSNLTLVPAKHPFARPGSKKSSPYAIKGGGWRQPDAVNSLNFLRAPAGEDMTSNYVGFRCAWPARAAWVRQRGRALISPWKSRSTAVMIPGGTYQLGRPVDSVLLQLSAQVNVSQYLGLMGQAEEAEKKAAVKFVTHTEVTVAQYQRFLRNFVAQLGFNDHPIQPPGHDHTPLRWQEQLKHPGQPVRGISWWSATAYADWLGGSLLSEQEWMLLAGGLSRQYPDTANAGSGVLRDPRFMQRLHTAIDDSNDINAVGLLSLGGNVMEWTRTIIPGSSLNFVLKGGSFRTPREAAKVSNTSLAPPEYAAMDLGFRVIFSERPTWFRGAINDVAVDADEASGTDKGKSMEPSKSMEPKPKPIKPLSNAPVTPG